MSASVKGFVITVLLLIALGLGCKSSGNKGSGAANNANAKTSSAKPDNQGIIHSGNGEEKEKPAAGKANVSGKVFYNEKAAANIEVKLCEKYQSVFRRVQRPSLHSEDRRRRRVPDQERAARNL